MPRTAFTLAATLACVLLNLAVPPAVATAAAGLSAEQMWALARLGDPTIAPDGGLAVVPVTRHDLKDNKSYTSLWLFPTDGTPGRQLTSGKTSDTNPAFSPDGRQVAFLSKRGDDRENQIYVIAIDGGEARRVTSVPTGAGALKWFPDGTKLASSMNCSFLSPRPCRVISQTRNSTPCSFNCSTATW